MMATSAPSRANSTAAARPMPESPPVTMATLSNSFSEPLYCGARYFGRGRILDSIPGFCWCCAGNGGLGLRLPSRGISNTRLEDDFAVFFSEECLADLDVGLIHRKRSRSFLRLPQTVRAIGAY